MTEIAILNQITIRSHCRTPRFAAFMLVLPLALAGLAGGCSIGSVENTGDPESAPGSQSGDTGSDSIAAGAVTTCGSTCTQCILSHRTDILPFYQSNGWDTSCGNRDNITTDWCRIDPAGCNGVKTGVCAASCGGGACGSPCTQCVLSHRGDILPFYQANGWDTSCGNRDNITSDWCRIDPTGCNGVKTGVCVATCGKPATSCSKLGGQAVQTTTPGFQSLLRTCPRVAKWVAVGGVDFSAIQSFKAACPASKTVLRMMQPSGQGGNYPTANDLWNARYRALDSATAAQKASVDYLESDNEADAGHSFVNPSDYNNFLIQFVNLARSKGFKPLVGNVAVGNPDGNVDCGGDGMLKFGAIVPAIVAAAQAGGGWGYHSYTGIWSKDMTYQSYNALRYRRFATCYPQLKQIPLVLTEGGFDNAKGPSAGGYLANGGGAPYIDWLAWYQRQIAGDSYVIGTTLFAYASGSNWSSFQLDPVEAQLENLIRTCP